MKINFTVKLRCLHRGRNFSIVTDARKYEIESDCNLELNIEHDYRDQSVLNLFSVDGMTAGLEQRVTIVEVSRNGIKWRNYFMFCELDLQNNSYVNNKTISPCREICFNGNLLLNIELGRDQFEFSQFYRSATREDFVFFNQHLDSGIGHDYWCSPVCGIKTKNNHAPRWANEPYLPKYKMSKTYDFACFGCSYTRGAGLAKGLEWPALVDAELGSAINLSEFGSGADSIFLNLKMALKQFKISRMVILWPVLDRFCHRWGVGGWHLRQPLVIGGLDADSAFDQIWMSSTTWRGVVSKFKNCCVSGWIARRSQRIVARTVKLLQARRIPAWHSSWSEETYRYLESVGLGSALLPPFPKSDCGAMDGSHPSAVQQRSWYESIKKQIAIVDG